MKHNLLLLLTLFVITACDEIDDVQTADGGCTLEYKTAYNKIVEELNELKAMTDPVEKNKKDDEIVRQCDEFFDSFSEKVECNGERDKKAVKVKGEDFTNLCDDPQYAIPREKIPEPLD